MDSYDERGPNGHFGFRRIPARPEHSERPRPRRVEPGEFPAWDVALEAVNRDVAATLPEHGPLSLLATESWREDGTEDVYVALPNGEWWGNALPPRSLGSPEAASAAVAEAAQDTVTERLGRAWPVCPAHDLGMHLRDESGAPVWWCAGGGRAGGPRHVRAAVGGLDAADTRSKHRKRKETGAVDGDPTG